MVTDDLVTMGTQSGVVQSTHLPMDIVCGSFETYDGQTIDLYNLGHLCMTAPKAQLFGILFGCISHCLPACGVSISFVEHVAVVAAHAERQIQVSILLRRMISTFCVELMSTRRQFLMRAAMSTDNWGPHRRLELLCKLLTTSMIDVSGNSHLSSHDQR